MLKFLIPLAILPIVVASTPAEARPPFWWLFENQHAYYYEPEFGYVPYEDEDFAAQDNFNQRQYERYRREMRKRYREQQAYYQDPDADPDFDYPYTPPKKLKKVKKAVAVPKPAPKLIKPVKEATLPPKTLSPKPKMVKAPQVASLAPPAKPKLAGVTCEKGTSIVASFGFSNVTTKSCSGSTFVYGAERSGKPFEIMVSAANGELTAVKKL